MTFNAQVIGTKELGAKVERMDEAVQGEKLELATVSGALIIVNAAKANVKSQGLIDTGTLRRSLHVGGHSEKTPDFSAGDDYSDVGGLVKTPTRVEMLAGTNLVYAAVNEYGGTIRPASGKYLAIPTGSYAGSPRDEGLVLKPLAGGGFALVEWDGNVAFILKESVEIPAKPYLRPAFDNNKDKAQNEIGKALTILIEKAIK